MLAVWPEELIMSEPLNNKSRVYSFSMEGMHWPLAFLAVKQKEKKPEKDRSLF
jgi:hypothetical protein